VSRWERVVVEIMKDHWQPEMRLWAALLWETAGDLALAPSSERFVDALGWVLCVEPFTKQSFDWVCTEVGLDPDWIRKDLLERVSGKVAA